MILIYERRQGHFSKLLERNTQLRFQRTTLKSISFGKGTCCVPAPDTYGPAISAISATPDFKPSVSNNLPTGVSNNSSTGKKNRTRLIVGISMGGGVLILVMLVFYLLQRRRPNSCDDEGQSMHNRCY